MDKHEIKTRARSLLNPVVGLVATMGIPPLGISLVGVALSFYGAVVVARGSLALGGLILLIAGLCDVLDGDVARRNNRVSPFGAFIDSTLDRVIEFAYFGAILLYIVNRPEGFEPIE